MLQTLTERTERPWATRDLPPFPPIATRVLGLLGNESLGLKDLSQTIASDAVFAAEVLRMANSAQFAAGPSTSSILRAVALLGLDRIRGLAWTVALRGYLAPILAVPNLRRCWRHSLACAVVAEKLSALSFESAGRSYTCGLMHDIGRIALVASSPREYTELIRLADESPLDLCAAERERFHIDHCEAGRQLVAEWNLPKEFQEVTAHHHDVDLNLEKLDLLALVALSCRLADGIGFYVSPPPANLGIEELLAPLPRAERDSLLSDWGRFELHIMERILFLDPL